METCDGKGASRIGIIRLTIFLSSKSPARTVDIYSSKFAVILIIILAGIFGLQLMSNSNNTQLIDTETCELYIKDSQINSKQYLKEFDSKCMEFKNLNP